MRAKFEDAFKRYVPTPCFQTATTPQVNATAGLSPIPNRNTDQNVAVGKSLKATDSASCGGVAVEIGGYSEKTLFEGDLEEREAIQAIDGEAALCAHCGELVGLNEPSIPCDGRVLHERCHGAYFGFERQDNFKTEGT
jgi:hypothetical protein